jgi:hypothetical protein
MDPMFGRDSDTGEKDIHVLTKFDRDYHQRARHGSVEAGLSLAAWMRGVLEAAINAEWPYYTRSDPNGMGSSDEQSTP